MTDNMFRRPVERLSAEVLRLITDDEGMSTAEYSAVSKSYRVE
ncbi:hypothetical protein [Gordonia tangerina]|nr:hypothetical protein [Gordonia tangerina]